MESQETDIMRVSWMVENNEKGVCVEYIKHSEIHKLKRKLLTVNILENLFCAFRSQKRFPVTVYRSSFILAICLLICAFIFYNILIHHYEKR